MISVTDKDKKNCCGCQACGDVCPSGAISYSDDNEGFSYPTVNKQVCMNCGLCERACPILSNSSIRQHGQHEPKIYGGYHKNLMVRFDSTSGGAFSALAGVMYKHGGYVAGAIHDNDWRVVNFISKDKRDLARLRSSKYVQSSARGLYKEIARLLSAGERVLACGAPCQMAALRSYLAAKGSVPTEKLIVVDFICLANYSPKVYAKYLRWLEERHHSKIVSVKWKNKDHGWRILGLKIVFENGDVYYGDGFTDPYRRGFHSGLFARPSCYACKFKEIPRCADITLGDFWGIERVSPDLDHNLGTSCILVNTEKGAEFFGMAKAQLVCAEFKWEDLSAGNHRSLLNSIPLPAVNRATFFGDVDALSFDEFAEKYFPEKSASRRSRRSVFRYGLRGLRFVLRMLRHPVFWGRRIRWNVLERGVDADLLHGRVFDVQSNCAIVIAKTGKVTIGHGSFFFGTKRNQKSKLESRMTIDCGASLEIGGTLYMKAGADLWVMRGSHLKMGSGSCNSGLQISCEDSITIGNDFHAGRDVAIRDTNGAHFIIQPGYTYHAPVVIGDHVWLCSGVKVMKGVTIGEGTVVSANSVVTHSLPAHCIASGNPAEVVAENIIWRA